MGTSQNSPWIHITAANCDVYWISAHVELTIALRRQKKQSKVTDTSYMVGRTETNNGVTSYLYICLNNGSQTTFLHCIIFGIQNNNW